MFVGPMQFALTPGQSIDRWISCLDYWSPTQRYVLSLFPFAFISVSVLSSTLVLISLLPSFRFWSSALVLVPPCPVGSVNGRPIHDV